MSDPIATLRDKCVAEGVEAEVLEDEEEVLDERGQIVSPGFRYLKFYIQRAGSSEEFLLDEEECQSLLEENTQFYQFSLLEGYRAIWSKTLGCIECALTGGPTSKIRSKVLLRLLSSRLGLSESSARKKVEHIDIPCPESGISIAIGFASSEHIAVDPSRNGVPSPENRELSIHFKGVEATDHDQARHLLDKLGNSVLFQIDLLADLATSLQ